MSINCPHCETENREQANFCKRCGGLIVDHCPRCNTELPGDSYFCDHCGLRLQQQSKFEWSPPTLNPSRVESKPVLEPTVEESTEPPTKEIASVGEAAESNPLLQQYIPKELLAKLESSSNGGMVSERRVVTMLFCDLQGSTAAAEQLDPEEWMEIINGAFEHMIGPVYQYEGTVARLMGDAIPAFFGAPIAHEDDPERAVLAGLEIVRALSPYREQVAKQYEVDFDVRVGINTGSVVVGAVGSDLRVEYTAMGDAINIASRMEQSAEPGTVQIAEDTYELIAPIFDVKDLGALEVKGKEEQVAAYRVLERKADRGRQRGIEGLDAPIVGREHELAAFEEAFAALGQGVGRILFVIGEAGLGKSRLIAESHAIFEDGITDGRWYEAASLSYERSQPYGLFQRLVRRLLGIKLQDSSATLRNAITSTVKHFEPEGQARAGQVLEQLFGFESALDGETFKRELLIVAADLFRIWTQETPAVFVFDDVHWSDPASVELIQQAFQLVDQLPLLLVCVFRPERQASSWQLRSVAESDFHHRTTVLELQPLSNSESNQLVDELLAAADLPEPLRARILEKSGGNPFFVEEVVRTFIDEGVIMKVTPTKNSDQNGVQWWVLSGGEDIDIPDTIQALLVARIDRLDEDVRQTLQMAAVIGRQFYYRVLDAISQSPEGKLPLEKHLSTLLRAGLIREAARIPELEYFFRNVLTQEAAHNTILRKQRRKYHLHVGEALESLFAAELEAHAVSLAFHFAGAGEPQRAFHYHILAGDAAFRLYAHAEARTHYQDAADLAREHEAIALDSEQCIHLFGNLGPVQELGIDYDAAVGTYLILEAEADSRNDNRMKLAALLARATVHSVFTPLFDPDQGETLCNQALGLARTIGDVTAETRSLWLLMLVTGFGKLNYAEAIDLGEQALALARQHENKEMLAFILNDLGRVIGFGGEPMRGAEMMSKALPIFEEKQNLPLVSDNLVGYGLLRHLAGRYQNSRESLQLAVKLNQSIDNHHGEMDARWMAAQNDMAEGFLGRAILDLEKLVSISQSHIVAYLPYLSRGYEAIGMHERALTCLTDYTDISEGGPLFASQFLAQLAHMYILRGEIDNAAQAMEGIGDEVRNLRAPLSTPIIQTQAELLHARQEYAGAALTLSGLIRSVCAGSQLWRLPELFLLQARIFQAKGDMQYPAVLNALEEGLQVSQEIGERYVRWQLHRTLATLAGVEGDTAVRDTNLRDARIEIEFLVQNLVEDRFRDTFYAQAEVRPIMEHELAG